MFLLSSAASRQGFRVQETATEPNRKTGNPGKQEKAQKKIGRIRRIGRTVFSAPEPMDKNNQQPRAQRARLQNSQQPKNEQPTAEQPSLPRYRAVARQAARWRGKPRGGAAGRAMRGKPRGRRGSRPSRNPESCSLRRALREAERCCRGPAGPWPQCAARGTGGFLADFGGALAPK